MEQIVITHPNGERLHLFSKQRPSAISKATQKVALLSDDLVSLTVVSAEPLNFDFGDVITIFGKPYKLNQLPEPTKEGERKYTYEVTLEGTQYDLIDVIYKLPEGCYGEQLYGDLEAHLNALIWNLNRIYPGKWILGTFPANTPFKNLNATGKNCLQVLQEYCEQYGVEFGIVINTAAGTYTLNIVEKVGVTQPFTLQYGRGKGLYKLQRKNINNAGITTRLYAYGGSTNLGSNYGHNKLCLPGTTRLTSYVESVTGRARYGIKENEKTFDDIKPERLGEVTSLGENVLSFADSSMFDLNEREQDGTTTKYLIEGATAKVTFQTGNLAGYSFDVRKYDHTTHTFVINKFTDENGTVFPSETSAAFQIAVGDKYIIEDINLPQQYITDAEARLLEQATKELEKVEQPQVSYALELDALFFAKTFGQEVSAEVLHVGDFIRIVDEGVGVDKEVRITRIERNLLKEHSYSITLADTVQKSNAVRVINEIKDINDVINLNGLADPAVARRRWQTAQELLSMVFDPDGDYFSEKIKPLSIETAMLAVGAKSQQFVLKNVTFEPNYNSSYIYLRISAGTLEHYAISEEGVVAWNIAGELLTLDTSSAYYIYARCSKANNTGTWFITKTQYKVEDVAGYYMFLIGTVSSPQTIPGTLEAVRSVSLTYGFSTVNGRHIKTGRIESTAGTCYFDLDNNQIGGVLQFVKSDGTVGNVADINTKADDAKNYIDNTLPDILDGIQAQLDGQIEQFFYNYDPTDATEPTSTWIAEDTQTGTYTEREKHLGDLFYNTDTGKVFRYVKIRKLVPPPSQGGVPGIRWVYQWQQLSDEELEQALAIANDALDLAKTKRRIFTTTPYTPYEVGDLWVQGSTGDIMRCKTARATGNYSASDWEKASKYTDDTALNNFVSGQFAQTIANLGEQIDGKIESYWSYSDPSTSWTEAEQIAHEGDMWYNPNDKTLKRWQVTFDDESGSFMFAEWRKIEDADAIAAYEAAAAAQDTADGKRRVFVATPYPPYDVGDLWLTGGKTNGQLFRCVTARATGSYRASDWAEAVYYDNTKTTIDGGIVTSGTVQLVSPLSESIVAGITGGENETSSTSAANKVRIWAGASKAQRFSAPFRVLQDGTIYATKANIEGTIKATDGEFRGKVYATDGEFAGRIYIGNGAIRLEKDGSGSLGNGQIHWQADYGALTIPFLNLGQVWGFNQLPVMASQYNPVNRDAALSFLDIPDNETVNLPSDPHTAFIYTIVNRTTKYKYLNGNGHKVCYRTEFYSGYYNLHEADSFTLGWAQTAMLIFDGKWYVISTN
jgi:hypothetical protein